MTTTPVRLSPEWEFVRESNAIERIHRDVLPTEYEIHQALWRLPSIRVGDLENFVRVICGAPLRRERGMNVITGGSDHVPPPGGPDLVDELEWLLAEAHSGDSTPFRVHVEYESLHPFIDGNGRSGRALWVWQMKREGRDPFEFGFLHWAYYQALEEVRGRLT